MKIPDGQYRQGDIILEFKNKTFTRGSGEVVPEIRVRVNGIYEFFIQEAGSKSYDTGVIMNGPKFMYPDTRSDVQKKVEGEVENAVNEEIKRQGN